MSIKHELVCFVAVYLVHDGFEVGVGQNADPALRGGEEYLLAAETECYLVGLHCLLMGGEGVWLTRGEDEDVIGLGRISKQYRRCLVMWHKGSFHAPPFLNSSVALLSPPRNIFQESVLTGGFVPYCPRSTSRHLVPKQDSTHPPSP